MKYYSVPFRFIYAASLLILLSGCDESSGLIMTDDNPALTGIFISGGAVEGLRYTTATQSGLTNINGQFQYLADENVTFSIGGIELGSAPGAEVVNPFDFFDMAPPATERAIRRELNNNNPTDFDRVANIALLLQTLDADGDSVNGINLEEMDARLASATISFDSNLFDFANNEMWNFSSAHGIGYGRDTVFFQGEQYSHLTEEDNDTLSFAQQFNTYSFNLTSIVMPLVNLYESLQVTVPVLLLESENEADGDTTKRYSFQYDAKGRQTTYLEKFDGNIDSSSSVTYDDDENTLTEQYEEYDDGKLDYSGNSTLTYDAKGKLLELVEKEDEYDNGELNSSTFHTYSYTYDPSTEKLLGAVYDYDETPDDDKQDESYPISYTYDTDGNLLTAFYEFYKSPSNSDTTPDSIVSYTHTFAANSFVVVEQKDNDYDGFSFKVDSISRFTYTYDDNGKLLRKDKEEDDNADGEVDSITSLMYTYYDNGNLLRKVEEIGYGADDKVDLITSLMHTYDVNGNLLRKDEEKDIDADGKADIISETEYTYAANGKQSTYFYREDNDVTDGIVNKIREDTYTYNDDGNPLTEVYKTDSNCGTDCLEDPNTESVTYTYDPDDGRLLSILSSQNYSDGSHSEQSYTYDYIEISDGLFALMFDEYVIGGSR